ncbi:hypothetical protein JXB11_02585 [Candidatus Woesearchaeota archaeon]|nr:hypothetical protein [Candidatus Woesearchaeota archaeon]
MSEKSEGIRSWMRDYFAFSPEDQLRLLEVGNDINSLIEENETPLSGKADIKRSSPEEASELLYVMPAAVAGRKDLLDYVLRGFKVLGTHSAAVETPDSDGDIALLIKRNGYSPQDI